MSFRNSKKELTSEEVGKIAEGLALQLESSQEVKLKIRAARTDCRIYFVEVE